MTSCVTAETVYLNKLEKKVVRRVREATLLHLDLNGNLVSASLPSFDPEFDYERLQLLRGLYRNIHDNNLAYGLDMTKQQYRHIQERTIAAYKDKQVGVTVSSSFQGPIVPTTIGALRKRKRGNEPGSSSEDETEFKVSLICDERRNDDNCVTEYLVRWKGYPAKGFEDAWEAAESVENTAGDLVDKFHLHKRSRPNPPELSFKPQLSQRPGLRSSSKAAASIPPPTSGSTSRTSKQSTSQQQAAASVPAQVHPSQTS
ncbi:hypothetical protein K435DRAFT_870006 [Dendrothele bispora CBS 962.96]|uniref:Chromo domain-containing protein n=1 Tax=Dendrothele bispora (strain CBS 962.96) TaxID=1314807 RepID=A0A4S8L834_DENBC|nr:hypothetical protein K435DRAFT_870006 [Dendrothele bispora CBS 962.96]